MIRFIQRALYLLFMIVRRLAKRLFPRWFLNAIWPVYRYTIWPINKRIEIARKQIYAQFGLFDPNEEYESEYYAKRREDPWRSDAQNVASALESVFDPDSIIDFGCAIGAYLEPFHDDGVEIHGVDAVEHAFEYAVVPTHNLELHDLTEPYEPKSEYDLVISIEVAEHLPENAAETFVDTLTKAGDTVVMTAAPPGQGGTNHLNEQPPSYWIKKFESRWFEFDRDTVEQLRQRINIEKMTWIEENVFVFRRGQ